MQFFQVSGGGGGASALPTVTVPQAAVASLASAASPFGLHALAAAAGISAASAPAAAADAPFADVSALPAAASAPRNDSALSTNVSTLRTDLSAPSVAVADLEPPNALVAAIADKAATIAKENSPEEASRETRRLIERQISIMEKERDRLVPIAAREHWIALIFAVLSGSVFLGTIALVVFAAGRQAVITLVSSVLPGFLSGVFFSRENKVEDRIAAIASDLRQSERTRDQVGMLEKLLQIVPSESRAKLADAGAAILA